MIAGGKLETIGLEGRTRVANRSVEARFQERPEPAGLGKPWLEDLYASSMMRMISSLVARMPSRPTRHTLSMVFSTPFFTMPSPS